VEDADDAWVGSGAASLTGWPDDPGLVPPSGLLERIQHLGTLCGIDAFAALTERAAVAGLSRRGQVSCGGATRLLRSVDGWIAVTLARADDVASVAAWLQLGHDPGPDPWTAVTDAVRRRSSAEVVDRGVLLGLPVAAVPPMPPATARPVDQPGAPTRSAPPIPPPCGPPPPAQPTATARQASQPDGPARWVSLGRAHRRPRPESPLVVDLSSLWAGPLCARTLAAHGAKVVKVESVRRPDGARRGPSSFFHRLHAGHRSVALDFATATGRHTLHRLVDAADVVITASRPRALEQLGLRPDDRDRDGPRVWVSITGHGHSGPASRRVAFGDDAAAGAGLVAPTTTGPVFVADAIADPLAGLAAAAAVLEALDHGGRWHLDVPLTTVTSWVAATPKGTPWRSVDAPPTPAPLLAPKHRAPELGADNDAVLHALARP
jgi:hypothetical protein